MSTDRPAELSQRKLRHIDACLSDEVLYHTKTAGFEGVGWPYHALPEVNLDEIDLSVTFLGKRLRAPLLIGAMTGGAARSGLINRNLALAAQELGIGMMLGSQRVMLEQPEVQPSFQVRTHAPDILLIGNLGAVQLLLGYGEREITRAIDTVNADALALHVNPLQEAFQAGGDTNWRGIRKRLGEVVPRVGYPLLLKEVGHGLGAGTARQLTGIPFAALDVAGAGGTNWAKVEDLVRHGRVTRPELAEVGIPTVQSLREVRRALPEMPLVASGGVRSGLDVAKSLALGASVAALARPLLAPALEGPEAVVAHLRGVIEELRVALFVAGLDSVRGLSASSPDHPGVKGASPGA
ncbi:type 2 isopentenyl-diphosphate Delta-isomerase [Deinococcus peraridilitoris]|uniref:Isopentenyl-diphosphate delta-isomerase n=1 Tax=Deinococcus peraridilitoris (strain DSM 19664 / LMG 22246 / CIP 109416 / KR-200) TaxID=937777 RepID=L0A3C7_DEIPD|nr:type 2 isopentenyl-diphosphate Delta-isomerase [Deinococcus peraridilitoris]AFZ68351.1 isopentenyl-diphosphate delta-isomerase, type 2 [Deinococcus peraridilitoris DSM 19664]